MNASSGSGLWPIRIFRIPGSVMAKVATRERLLDAALEVFARKGYHRARLLRRSRAPPRGLAPALVAPGSEAEPEVPGADRADDRVAVPRRVHLAPRPPEVRRPVRVIGGDLHQRDLRRRVERPVVAGVRHLHGVEGEAVAPDRPRALGRLRDREPVARRVV